MTPTIWMIERPQQWQDDAEKEGTMTNTEAVPTERDWFRPEDAEYIESIRLIERDHIIRSLRAHKEQRSNGTMAAPAGWWTAAKFIEGLE